MWVVFTVWPVLDGSCIYCVTCIRWELYLQCDLYLFPGLVACLWVGAVFTVWPVLDGSCIYCVTLIFFQGEWHVSRWEFQSFAQGVEHPEADSILAPCCLYFCGDWGRGRHCHGYMSTLSLCIACIVHVNTIWCTCQHHHGTLYSWHTCQHHHGTLYTRCTCQLYHGTLYSWRTCQHDNGTLYSWCTCQHYHGILYSWHTCQHDHGTLHLWGTCEHKSYTMGLGGFLGNNQHILCKFFKTC